MDDNECFKWYIVRYFHPAIRNPARTTKADKDFAQKFNFKEIEFSIKARDVNKIEKKNSSALVLLVMKIKKNIQSMYKNVVNASMLIYY